MSVYLRRLAAVVLLSLSGGAFAQDNPNIGPTTNLGVR